MEDLHRRAFEKEGKERICILVSREKSSGDSDGSSDPADYSNRCSGCGKMGKKLAVLH